MTYYLSDILPLNATICLIALVLDRLFGEPQWIYNKISHPVVFFAKALTKLENIFYTKSAPHVMILQGGLCFLTYVSLITGITYFLAIIFQSIDSIGIILSGLLASTLIAHKSLHQHVNAVKIELINNNISKSRTAVSMIVGRDTQNLNSEAIARAAIESTAENYSDGVVAPWFFLIFFGLPGLAFYKAINTADSMIGYRNEKYLYFGRIAARVDDIANYIPARLTALIILLSQSFKGLKYFLRGIKQEAQKHSSLNAGWPESAMAKVLNISLAGPRIYDGIETPDEWIFEKGRKDINAKDINNALIIANFCWWILFSQTVLIILMTL